MKYDLEQRTLEFSKKVIDLINKLPKSHVNIPLMDQLLRSATSIGANYREANDALGKKDFYMRVKICRKEAKETNYWLALLSHNNPGFMTEISGVSSESEEFVKIFSAIIKSSL